MCAGLLNFQVLSSPTCAHAETKAWSNSRDAAKQSLRMVRYIADDQRRGRPMVEHLPSRDMMMAAAFIALTILMLAWQVLRAISRGGLDAIGAIRLACSIFVLGIMLYVGYTMLSLWT
jgi:hypothetical protein